MLFRSLKTNSIIFGMRIYGELNEGDIIVFKKDGDILVKRIVAVEEQEIEAEGKVYVVPKDCYFVMGDNRDNSWDSRFWEEPFVNKDNIIARL